MKRIALFGGTGQTGREFLKVALAAGYEVKALVRDPTKATPQADGLTWIAGEVLYSETVQEVVAGTEVVVSLFGHVKGSLEWLQTSGTQNIVKAMKKEGVSKIISLSGGGLPNPEKDQPKLPDRLIRLIMKIAVPKVLNDAVRHHEVLRDSGVDWVIVRGPRLTNDSRQGQYRVGWVGVNASTKISRADLADFILKQVEDNTYLRQMPFVSY